MHHGEFLVRIWDTGDIHAGDFLAAIPEMDFLAGRLRASGAEACRRMAAQTLTTLEESLMVADYSLADELRALIFMMCRESPEYSSVVAQWESTHPPIPVGPGAWGVVPIGHDGGQWGPMPLPPSATGFLPDGGAQ